MVQYKSARFYNWEEIDSMLRKWGSGHFLSGGVYAAGERDENSFAIWLKYLLPEDVSLKIMGDLIDMQIDVECATYEGVYFFTE